MINWLHSASENVPIVLGKLRQKLGKVALIFLACQIYLFIINLLHSVSENVPTVPGKLQEKLGKVVFPGVPDLPSFFGINLLHSASENIPTVLGKSSITWRVGWALLWAVVRLHEDSVEMAHKKRKGKKGRGEVTHTAVFCFFFRGV